MKHSKLNLFINSICITAFAILLTVTYTFEAKAQKNETKKRVRTIYVTSSAKAKIASKSPKIKIVKNSDSKKASPPQINSSTFSLEKKTFELINKQRANSGLSPLKWNEKIASLARKHSENMARYKFFSHKGLNGRLIDERATDFGIDDWQSISENIAFNKGFNNPGEFAVGRWMQSSSHRRNLLHTRWQESGVGIAVSQDGAYYFTQIFLYK